MSSRGRVRERKENNMNTIIRDARQRPVGHLRDSGNTVRAFDATGGRLLGVYSKGNRSTYDSKGRLVGPGNQLLRLVR